MCCHITGPASIHPCPPAEATELAGVDYMTVSPSVLDSLQATATMQGYNDGLSGAAAVLLSVMNVQHGTRCAMFYSITNLAVCGRSCGDG